MSVLKHALLLAGIALLGSGCVPASSIKPVHSLAELGEGEVLVVGKVELDPPLAPDEQELGDSYEEFRNAVMLITDDELREAHELAFGDLSSRIDAPFGETFFVSHPAQPFWILKGWVVMHAKVEVTGPGGYAESGNAPLFGTFHIDLQPDDKAVYIGTIRYHRDDFFGTEKVVVKDEFREAQAAFREKFGTNVQLRKSLATPLMP